MSTDSESSQPTQPPLRVITADATAEEVAAIVAVLAAASGSAGSSDNAAGGRSRWAAPAARLRSSPLGHGPGAWRASARS